MWKASSGHTSRCEVGDRSLPLPGAFVSKGFLPELEPSDYTQRCISAGWRSLRSDKLDEIRGKGGPRTGKARHVGREHGAWGS